MSRGIVSQKPFARKKRKQSFKKMLNRSGISIPEISINSTVKNILSRWVWLIVLIIIWFFILIKSLFFQDEHIITDVKFSQNTLDTYQDIELFNVVSSLVKWKNYYTLSYNKSEILSKIQKQFPFVWAIEFQLENNKEKVEESSDLISIAIHLPSELPIVHYETVETPFPLKESVIDDEWWTLWIELQYYEPVVLVKINDKKFAVRDESTYVELKDGMLLWIRGAEEDPLFTIETPQYLSGTTELNWLFFELSLKNLLEISSLAQETFPEMLRFVYLAWSTRIAIFVSDKTLYFNFPKGSSTVAEQRELQIKKYNTLKNKYNKFNQIWAIDLWALETNKTIIKSY